MKRFILAASLLALAGCSQAEEADVAEGADEAVVEDTVATALDGKPAVGMYKVTTEDGEVRMFDAKADGTYETTMGDEVLQTGVWDQPSPDQFCSKADEQYISDTVDGERECSTETYTEDGVWISTDEDGETVTVERVES